MLTVLLVYALYGWWWSNNRLQVQMLYQWFVGIFVKIMTIPYIVMFPLYLLFLQRGVPVDTILQTMLLFYFVIMVFVFIMLWVFGGEKIYEFFTGERFMR
jgi:ABC-type xylose transport system permease subunit